MKEMLPNLWNLRSFSRWVQVSVVVALLAMLTPVSVLGAPPSYGPVVHVVQWGENLSSIAVRYGVGIHELAAANLLDDPNRVYVGQRLVIPVTPAPAPQPAGNVMQHVVTSGDTLSALAAQYRTTVNAIVEANRLVNPSYIYVGQVLTIPTSGTSAPMTGVYYVVRPGDTMAGVAYRFGVSYWAIVQANNLANPTMIHIGQTLFIPGGAGPAPGTPSSVEGWVGAVFSTADGSEYDDYFESPDGVRYGIDSTDPDVQQQIADLRDSEAIIYVWGTLYRDVSDVNGTQIQVTYLERWQGDVGVTPTPGLLKCTPLPETAAATPIPTCAVPTATPIPLGAVPLPPPAPPKPLYMDTPEYGMEVQLWGMGDCVMDRDLRLVKDAGFTWVKQLFRWRDIEVQKGKFDWSEADHVVAMVNKYNLDLAIAVAYQPEWAGGGYPLNGPPRNMKDFAEFMSALAGRYQGLVRAYEIWPGPNVSKNWGGMGPDPQRYGEMLIDAYWYAKGADPYAMIISGGLVQTAKHDGTSMPPITFFKELYEVKGVKNACDVFGVEALGYKAAPENTPLEAANPDLNNRFPATKELNQTWCFRSVEVLYEASLPPSPYPRPDRQWAITRMGWTTDERERSNYGWAAVSEEIKADYLWRAYRYAKDNWSGWMGVMFVPLTSARWSTQDDEYWWGVVNPDGCPRKSYYTLKAMSK
jgi:LysM repeat protein